MRRAILGVLPVVTVTALPLLLVGALAVQIREDLAFTSSALGWGVTIYFVLSALSSTGFGRLTERTGAARSMRVAAAAASLSMLGLAVARSVGHMFALLALAGLSNALAQPAANALLMEHMPPDRRGLGFGVKQAAIPAAALLAGLAVPTVALTAGWRWAFVIGSGCGLAALVTVPRTRQTVAADAQDPLESLRGAYRPMILLSLAAAIGSAAAHPLGAFATTSGVGRGLSPAAAGTLLAASSAVGLVARVAAGWFGDRRPAHRLLPSISVMLGIGAAGYALMSAGPVTAFVTGMFLAFGFGWAWQGLFGLTVASRWSAAPAAATGVTQAGLFLGGAVGPTLFAFLSGRFSDRLAWLVMAALATLAAALIRGVRAILPVPAPHE